jgi:DNA primase
VVAGRPGVPDGEQANERRARLLLATLLAHPALLPDTEEAFAHIPLNARLAPLRDALTVFTAQEKPLDRQTLLTHLQELGLAETARLIESAAAADFRPPEDDSLSAAAQRWWGWYNLMDDSLDMLRTQRDEQQRLWNENQDDMAAWLRLKRYNELLVQARSGELGVADP